MAQKIACNGICHPFTANVPQMRHPNPSTQIKIDIKSSSFFEEMFQSRHQAARGQC
jgi:hypothetical protein